MQSAKAEFLPHVHSFRAFAIAAVVATHALYDLHWFEKDRIVAKFAVSIVQNGTVPFVFVAGFLFQHLLGRFRYRSYVWTKLKYVILPYVVASLPYVFLQKHRHFGIFAEWVPTWLHSDVLHVARAYLSGNQMPIPLWFIPMIAAYYLCAPVFVAVDRRPKFYWSLVPLLLLAAFAHRPRHQTDLDQSLVYFLPVYLAGMWTSHYREKVLAWMRRFRWLAVLSILAAVSFEVVTRERSGAIESAQMFSTERGVFDVNIFTKVGASLVLLEALQRAPGWLHRALSPVAEMSFGVFFLHYYFIYFARDLRVQLGGAPWAGGLLNLFSYTLVLMLLSLLVVYVLRRLLGPRSRYLVGS